MSKKIYVERRKLLMARRNKEKSFQRDNFVTKEGRNFGRIGSDPVNFCSESSIFSTFSRT